MKPAGKERSDAHRQSSRNHVGTTVIQACKRFTSETAGKHRGQDWRSRHGMNFGEEPKDEAVVGHRVDHSGKREHGAHQTTKGH